MLPSISVLTPNFNHGRLIENSIASIAKQSVPAFEQIIIDDGSTDDSRAQIKAVLHKYPFVRYFENDKNEGAVVTVNRAIREARGKYLLFLSADDVLLPMSIERMAAVLAEHPDAALICGEVLFKFIDSGHMFRRRYLDVEKPIYLSPQDLIKQQRRTLYVVNSGAAIVRRDALIAANLYDPGLRWHCDVVAFNMIAYRYGVWYVPEVLHCFSLDPNSYSSRSLSWKHQRRVFDRLFDILEASHSADVREKFRDSTILATLPMILRYMLIYRKGRNFLTFKLAVNALLCLAYRKAKRIAPEKLLTLYIRIRAGKANALNGR